MEEAKKTPLIRLSKRDAMDPKKVWAIRIGSILVALIIGCIPILITGNNPFKAYVVIINGSLGTSFYFKRTNQRTGGKVNGDINIVSVLIHYCVDRLKIFLAK